MLRNWKPDCLPVLPGWGAPEMGHARGHGAPETAHGGARAPRDTWFTSSRVSSWEPIRHFGKHKKWPAEWHRARKAGSGLTV